MKKELDTAEKVKEWAHNALYKRGTYEGDTETAAYLARAVRIAEAWDEWRNAPHGQEYPPHTCERCLDELYGQLSEAAAEGGADE